ncbi:MAG: hypothetical protein DWP92_05565 [Armatimonadetes bacterium]|nr:MAG: hypothetical protein DWP92_05565 [Armatimonadota bacterium]
MYESLEDVRQAVVDNSDVLTVEMRQLRDAHGAGRLGVHVRTNISKKLRGLGLGHYPVDLPDRQEQMIRIYRQGSPIAEIVDAVLNPSMSHDAELRQAVGGDAQQILDLVRELVCD